MCAFRLSSTTVRTHLYQGKEWFTHCFAVNVQPYAGLFNSPIKIETTLRERNMYAEMHPLQNFQQKLFQSWDQSTEMFHPLNDVLETSLSVMASSHV
ncbi:uncharacterized protein LOC143211393 isoform X2 [Lasioglossum baleicum]|uniref:uncharacterized protein LOC143211393 isoform X2 n=1 Tax=Lasioglossum baleicum TaxID=434251 RepID=UPI003FCC5AF9